MVRYMKILIFTEEIAGRGHTKAALSLVEAFEKQNINYDIQIASVFSMFNERFKNIISYIYLVLIKKTPNMWRIVHNRHSNFSLFIKKIIGYFFKPRLNKFLEKENPDIIIATHACGLEALSQLKRKYNYSLIAVFTDFQVNSYWICDGIDNYFVPHVDIKNRIIENYQINPEKIFVSGIPISATFSDQVVQQTYENIKLAGVSSYSILVMGGGLGLGKIEEIIFLLTEIKTIRIILSVVTGENTKLYQELLLLKSQIDIDLNIYGYCKDIKNLMINNDILITKPGGLTISEALAVQIPIILYKPIPGQEEYNANFLVRNNAAIRVNNINKLKYSVEYLCNDAKLIDEMKYQQQKLAKSNAANDIVSALVSY